LQKNALGLYTCYICNFINANLVLKQTIVNVQIKILISFIINRYRFWNYWWT